MTQPLLNRSIERWRGCDPQYMATEQSPAAIAYAFEDAKHDILALAEMNRELVMACRAMLAENSPVRQLSDACQFASEAIACATV